jgi:hypothetical protein
MKLPPTKPNAVEEAVLMVPVVVPPAAEATVVNTVPPPPAEALMVMLGDVEAWDSVMFAPATRPKAVDDAVFTVPLVAPAPAAMVCRIDWLAAEIVTAGFVEFCDRVIKLPATRLRFDDEAVLIVPVVVPPAADVIENSTDWLGP